MNKKISMEELMMYIGLAADKIAERKSVEQQKYIMEIGADIGAIVMLHLVGEPQFSKTNMQCFKTINELMVKIYGECPKPKPAGEDKQEILNALLPALQKTRNLEDLETLIHIKGEGSEEFVVATFDSGNSKTICVSMDSGTAMIKDVITHIV